MKVVAALELSLLIFTATCWYEFKRVRHDPCFRVSGQKFKKAVVIYISLFEPYGCAETRGCYLNVIHGYGHFVPEHPFSVLKPLFAVKPECALPRTFDAEECTGIHGGIVCKRACVLGRQPGVQKAPHLRLTDFSGKGRSDEKEKESRNQKAFH